LWIAVVAGEIIAGMIFRCHCSTSIMFESP
jgi:hypothetical protein